MILEALKITHSPVGPIALGATTKGIATLEILGSSDSRREFSNSVAASKLIDQAANQLDEYFRGSRSEFDLPLDLVGTDFQKAVWQRLLKIGFGKTKSYGEVALEVSKPLAARAVGGAVGANPVPIIVPCHRVMGSTGKLTGYSATGGLETKAKLLKLEGILS
ncbi:MAG: methylated-DNA--[protein]-cysteine S-methyltransferase [Actinobacteria bacterium]|nr:methylated-DNA--[protein]-cysteine S-methyltransferase [Actinomycetota bacterium]